MMIVVRILHVIRLFSRGETFCFVYNNYSMQASLNFIQVVLFINHQGIKK